MPEPTLLLLIGFFVGAGLATLFWHRRVCRPHVYSADHYSGYKCIHCGKAG